VKTGYTPQAGQCLVSSAQSGGRSLIAVVLGAEVIYSTNSEDRRQFSESRRLLRHGFSDFKVQTLISPGTMMSEVPVRLSKTVPYVVAQPNKTIEAILPSSFDPEYLTTTVTLAEDSVEAPVQQGQVLGTISVTYKDLPYGQADLVAANNVPRSFPKLLWDRTLGFFSSPMGVIVMAALAGYFLFHHIKGVRRKPRGGGHSRPSNIIPHPGRDAAARATGKAAPRTSRPMGPAPGKPHSSRPNPDRSSTGKPSQRHR
jgi:D-alanyl-D-alanine carboxypeptidase (penicillin-binding protein 5/6)